MRIDAVVTPLQATGSSGDQVEVVATRRGRRSDPERLNECLAGNKGRMNSKNNDVSISISQGGR